MNQRWLAIAFIFSVSSAQAAKSPRDCSGLIRSKDLKYTFAPLATIQSLSFRDSTIRKTMIEYFARKIIKKKRLPTEEEISDFLLKANLESEKTSPWVQEILDDPNLLIGKDGLFESVEEIFLKVSKAYPTLIEELKSKVAKQAFLFFRHRLKPPTIRELGDILKFEDLRLLQAIVQQKDFLNGAVFSDLGRHLDYARKRIKTGYARAIRGTDTPAVNRTRRLPPTLRRLVEVMILTKSNEHYQWRAITGDYGKFDISKPAQLEKMLAKFESELSAMLGISQLDDNVTDPYDKLVFNFPNLFPKGEEGLKISARGEYQPTFTSLEDKVQFPFSYAESVRQKIVEAPGIIVSTIIPGLKIDWDFLEGMITMSKEKKYPIILIPSDGMLNDLDPEITNHPSIHILTNTIENNEFMLALYPSNLRPEPLAPFKKPGMFRIGQQIILPHHILAHESIPTAKNSINATQLYSTGVVNLPEMGAVGKIQKQKVFRVLRELKRSFLVATKVDKGTGNFGGVTNSWHIRPVELKPASQDQPPLFVDLNRAYLIRDKGDHRIVERKPVAPVDIKIFDLHLLVSDPSVLQAFKEFIEVNFIPGQRINLVCPDGFENLATNRHVEIKQGDTYALNNLNQTGRLSFADEINEGLASINALLAAIPEIDVVFEYSNHTDDWIERNLRLQPTDLQRVVNGPLIDELRNAVTNNPRWTPLEYLLIHRENVLKRTNVDGSESYKDRATFISDPSRIRVVRKGERLTSPPDDQEWEVALQHHGHQGANGAKSSFKTHATGEERIVTGDAHRPGYIARGERNFWMGVGAAFFDLPYTAGGYSSWGVAFAAISSYNTMQLIQYDPGSQSFIQRENLGFVKGEAFFPEPLKIIGATDDDERRKQQDTKEFDQWFKTQFDWLKKNVLQPPSEE